MLGNHTLPMYAPLPLFWKFHAQYALLGNHALDVVLEISRTARLIKSIHYRIQHQLLLLLPEMMAATFVLGLLIRTIVFLVNLNILLVDFPKSVG